jgi:hypothetical protein
MATASTMATHVSVFALTPTEDPVLKNDVVALVNQLWSLPSTKTYVPCPNPSNLERKDLPTVSCQEYVVSPKTDGTRLFLLMGALETTGQKYSVFIDRAYTLYPVRFAAKHQELYSGTLLDGEMTREINGDSLFTVFDAVAVEGFDLKRYPFSQRKEAYEGAAYCIRPPNGLSVLPKLWFPLNQSVQVYQENQSTSDGLILQPVQGKLKAGIQPDVFKWKPGYRQTIDFYVSLNDRSEVLLECGYGAEVINGSELDCFYDTEPGAQPYPFTFTSIRKVYECAFNRFEVENTKLFFVVIKAREDKTHANDARVVVSTLRALQEGIKVEELAALQL